MTLTLVITGSIDRSSDTVEHGIDVGPVMPVNCANKGDRNFRRCLLVAVIFDGAALERKIDKKMISKMFELQEQRLGKHSTVGMLFHS